MTKFKTAAVAAISAGALAGVMLAGAQTASSCYTFTANMKMGTTNTEVMQLQKSLNAMGYTVATTGAGSMGMENNYFGAKTKAAVAKFQSANGVTSTGNVFGLTRSVLNAKCGTTGTTTTPTVSGAVSVSLASTQPTSVIVAGSARTTLATLNFTGNGTVTNVKLMRTGVSNNSTLTNVYLYDAATGARITDSASALTDGTINFNNATGIMTVAGSRAVNVVADIASGVGVSGQSVGVALVSYATAGNPVAMVSGVNGPTLPIGSADLATAYFGTVSPSATDINAGTVGTTVWSSTLNVGTRAVRFSSATFKYVGSAPVDSLANVKLYVDGVQFANAATISSNGYVTFTGSAMNLTTGNHTFDVRADVMKGSNRSFYISMENAGDIAIQDSQLMNANVTVKTGSAVGATISNLTAGTVTIKAGSVTISQNSGFVNTTLVGGSTNQVLGSFRVYAYGEDVKINSLPLAVYGSSVTPTTTAINNVTVYVNGGAVTSGITATLGATTTVNLGSNLIVPAGTSTVVEVRGDLVNSGNSNLTAGSFTVSLGAGSSNAQGQYSSNLVSTPLATGQIVSVSNGNVNFGATSGFTAANIAKNQAGVKIGSFSLQAGSAEAVNVTNINVILAGTATAGTEYTNLRITDGSQTIVPVSGTNNFSVNYDVAAGATKVVEVWVDTLEIGSKTIIASSTVTYRGRVSNTTNTVSATAPTQTVANVTVSTPAVVGASTLGSRYVIGGQTVSNVVTYNVTATNGAATINDLTFTVAGTGVESMTIGNTTAANVGGSVNFYGVNLAVAAGSTGLNIPVSVKYSAVASNGGVASESVSTTTLTGMKYTAAGTVTSTTTLSVAANAMTLVASTPTVKKTSTGTSLPVGTTANAKIGTINVAADAKGDVTLFVLPYSLGSSVSNVVVKANGTDVTNNGGTATTTSTTFTNGYRIAAGTSVSFDVYGDVNNGGTTSANFDVTVGSSNNFKWSDVVDNKATSAAATKTGALLTTYNN